MHRGPATRLLIIRASSCQTRTQSEMLISIRTHTRVRQGKTEMRFTQGGGTARRTTKAPMTTSASSAALPETSLPPTYRCRASEGQRPDSTGIRLDAARQPAAATLLVLSYVACARTCDRALMIFMPTLPPATSCRSYTFNYVVRPCHRAERCEEEHLYRRGQMQERRLRVAAHPGPG